VDVTALCGWLAADREAKDGAAVVAAMGRALRVHRGQTWSAWSVAGLAVGLLELPAGTGEEDPSPAVTPDGRHHLWMAGEACDGGGLVEVPACGWTRTLEFRRALLAALLRQGVERIAALDGEYQVVLWDARERALTLLNDRFGALPLYWGRSAAGFAFAGGVRGVLAAPGISSDPDPEAIREAVSFGSFRLGERTNVAAVRMAPGAAVLAVRDGATARRRSWCWSDLAARPARPLPELIEQADGLWRQAISRRLAGAARPGQTLSGGLDSRAILAAAAPAAPCWTAITYGVPGCDDERYARRAAAAVGATWVFHPLYSGRDPDWLERRTGHVQETDGLIDLVDLMHLETLPLQARLLDLHLSGYAGDAVAGPTFTEVTDAAGVLDRLPYYGGRLGLEPAAALARAGELVAGLGGAPPRYALFEHKLPQSTNRWSAAWRPWLRVRRPFTDLALFDFFQELPPRLRGAGALYEHWLRQRYAACFAAIPNQKTGLPVLAAPWRLHAARACRLAWRALQPGLARLGLPARPRRRAYTADEEVWQQPGNRWRIVETVLRPGAIACDLFGRPAVAATLDDWFERGAGATQVIAALYVYEAYHRDLSAHLRRARQEPETAMVAVPRPAPS
jgi:glutamine amidotransferase-like protein/asparagine synthase